MAAIKYVKVQSLPRMDDPLLNRALHTIDGELSKIARVLNNINTDNIPDDAITSDKIFDGAVLNAKLADECVDANKIADDAIIEAKIAAGAITSLKTSLAAINATDGTLNTNSVGSLQIQTDAVTEAKVLADAITAVKINVADFLNLPSDEDLVGYWSLDEGSGTLAVDGSGNGNDGTLQNMEEADWVDGVVGKCLDFDGDNDWVELPINAFGTGPVSMAFWIKTTETAEMIPLTIEGGWFFKVGQGGSNNKIGVSFTGSSADIIDSTSVINDDEWHFVIATHDGTTARLSIDGSEENSATQSLYNIDELSRVSAIGGQYNGSFNINALIDEVRIYKTALTAAEIKALYLYPAGNKGVRISGGQIAAETILADQLAANCITGVKILAGEVTANKLSTYNFVVSEGTWASNDPDAGKVSWTDIKVVYDGTESTITNGNTTDKFIYWESGSPTVFSTSATIPALGNTDFLVVMNYDGSHVLVWNSTLIDGGRIRTGTVTATNIVAGTITATELGAGCVTTDKLYANAVTAPKINVVGLDGETGRIIVADQTDADEITDGINTHALTLIEPGKVLISGETDLADWRHGVDATFIDGGKIYTQSITAEQILAGTITADEIFAGTITADEIKIGSISLDRLDTYLGEPFDGLTTGAIDGQGDYVWAGTWDTTYYANCSCEVVVLAGEDKMLRLTDNNIAGIAQTELAIDEGSILRTASFKINVRQSVNNATGWIYFNMGETPLWGIRFKDNGKIAYWDGGQDFELQNYAQNTWYEIRVFWDLIEGGISILVDNILRKRVDIASDTYVDTIMFTTGATDTGYTLDFNGMEINNLIGWSASTHQDVYESSTPTLAGLTLTGAADLVSFDDEATKLGKIGNVSINRDIDTEAEWAALPVGHSQMMWSGIGIAGGAPVDNHGYFVKTANRDTGGGWGGIWVGYTAGQNYMGRAVISGVFASWDKLWSDANDGTGSGLDADKVDGEEAAAIVTKARVDAIEADHGALSGRGDNDHTQYILHSLAGAANDFLVASGANTYIKKTLAETGAILEGDMQHNNLQGYAANRHVVLPGTIANVLSDHNLATHNALNITSLGSLSIGGVPVITSTRLMYNFVSDIRYYRGETETFMNYQPNQLWNALAKGYVASWNDETGVTNKDRLWYPDTTDQWVTLDMALTADPLIITLEGTISTTSAVTALKVFFQTHGGKGYNNVSFQVKRNDDVWVNVPAGNTSGTLIFSETLTDYAAYPTYTPWKGIRVILADKTVGAGNRYIYGVGLYSPRSFLWPQLVYKKGDTMYGALTLPKIIMGSYYLDDSGLVANNKVADSYKWHGLEPTGLTVGHVPKATGASAIAFQANNLGGLSDVTLGSLEEGETISYLDGEWVDAWGVEYDNPRLVWKMDTDFFSADRDSNDPWVGYLFGGSLSSVVGTSNHPGIVRFSCNLANQGCRFMTATNCIRIAGAEHSEFMFRVPTILPNLLVRLGFQDSTTATIPTDGVYIDISASGTLVGKTRNSGSGSTTSSYAISNNTWYRAKIVVNSDATLVTFYLYNEAGQELWSQTLSANIPTASGRETGHGVVMTCSSSVARSFDLDKMIATRAGHITR